MLNLLTPEFDAIELQFGEIYRNLGYGTSAPDAVTLQTVDEIVAHAHNICKPMAQYTIFPMVLNSSMLVIGNVEMNTGKIIANYLSDSTEIAVFVATAGLEFDNYLQKIKVSGDIYMEFLADAVGSEIAEATVRYVNSTIQKLAYEKSMYSTLSYSPGYCGWHVREQPKLFSLLPANSCGISLNESCLMHPVKSVSGIIGLSKNPDVKIPYTCDICVLDNCYKRKTK